MLSDVSGLRDDLVHVFEDSEQTDKVLSMAYYSLVGSGSFSHLAFEQRITWFPSDSPIEAWDAMRVTASITENDKQVLFRWRKARAGESVMAGRRFNKFHALWQDTCAEILDIYGMRDEQEKSFMFIKSE